VRYTVWWILFFIVLISRDVAKMAGQEVEELLSALPLALCGIALIIDALKDRHV